MIKVAVIDDNPRSRNDLVKIFAKEPDINVVAEAEASPAGISDVEQQRPDVIVLENHKPFLDGLQKTAAVVSKFDAVRVLVLDMNSEGSMQHQQAEYAITASSCQSGACFHLCQNCSTEEILAAIRLLSASQPPATLAAGGGEGMPERTADRFQAAVVCALTGHGLHSHRC
jgi:chemotaxis response regulator CheB